MSPFSDKSGAMFHSILRIMIVSKVTLPVIKRPLYLYVFVLTKKV